MVKRDLKIPKKIRAGALTVTVDVTQELDNKYADFDRNTCTLRINKLLKSNDMIRISMIHELIHAAENNNTCIAPLEEPQVDNIAAVFYSIIKDNPDFIKWVQHGKM